MEIIIGIFIWTIAHMYFIKKIDELWAKETGVSIDNSEQIKYNEYWHTDLTKAEVIEFVSWCFDDIRYNDLINWTSSKIINEYKK